MKNKNRHLLTRRNFNVVLLAASCLSCSFLLGIKTAGEVQPFQRIEAQANSRQNVMLRGDANGDGVVSVADALTYVDVLSGVHVVTPQMLASDTDGDGTITFDDLRFVLQHL